MAYHYIFVPVATSEATVVLPQKLCAEAVGAAGTTFIVTATALRVLSQPATEVWLA